MLNEILAKIPEIESQRGIRILFAAESGSRAWGFPSPDSDYDVRFVYLRPLDWYLSLGERKDTVDVMVNEVLDINGWDLRKFLRAIPKTNATPFEWLQSPIIYKNVDGFQEALWALSKPFFNPIPGSYHYLAMARNSLEAATVGDQIRLKKYFYVLRPILAARWIAERNEAPPMEFHLLLDQIRDRKEIMVEIDRLLEIKKDVNESFTLPPNQVLQDFIREEFSRLEENKDKIQPKGAQIEDLNTFFIEWVRKYGDFQP